MLRFNRRWPQFLEQLNLEPANTVIDQYNRYYVLEKECVMGSRGSPPGISNRCPLTTSTLLNDHPTLPVPELVAKTGSPMPRFFHGKDNA